MDGATAAPDVVAGCKYISVTPRGSRAKIASNCSSSIEPLLAIPNTLSLWNMPATRNRCLMSISQGVSSVPAAASQYPVRDANQNTENRGMQMKMLVCVDVIEKQSGARKCQELGADLGFELLASGGTRKISYASEKHILADASLGVCDAGDLRMRKRR